MTSGAHPYRLPDRYCPLCGDKIINPGAHAERCYGRSARIAPPPEPEETCGCPPGMFHQPLCPLVTGKDAA